MTKHDLMTSLLYDDDINRCHGKFGDEVMEDVTVGRGVEGGVKKGGGVPPREFLRGTFSSGGVKY